MPEEFVEVRIPTHKRPQLLRRALSGLVAQTSQAWRAVVLDDSPSREGEAVCESMGDARILYAPNARNLGMAQNISQAFRPHPFLAGAAFGCVLEDDNFFEPSLIEKNLAALRRVETPVMVRNYKLVEIGHDGTILPTPEQPMRELYGRRAREIRLEERIREAFHTFTLGNLGYFWRFDRGVDLSAAEEPFNSPVAEPRRALAFPFPCWYEPEPHAVFSRFPPKKKLPPKTHQEIVKARLGRLGELKFMHKLVMMARHAEPEVSVESLLREDSKNQGDLVLRLAQAGSSLALSRLRTFSDWKAVVKSLCLWLQYERRYNDAVARSVSSIRENRTSIIRENIFDHGSQ